MSKRRDSAVPCKARGVSLPRDVDERVNERLDELKPKVKGFSHYVQLLIHRDLNNKRQEEFKSFNQPDLPLDGFGMAA